VVSWVKRLRRLCPVEAISLEVVKFDLQQMKDPEISGVEYQHGTLFGYELRQYLLEKWDRACSYCGAKQMPLQVEHIQAKANGGTDRVSNLTLACDSCNQAKGTRDIRVFLAEKPELLARILAQARASLKDAAAVNTTRWALYERLKQEGLPLERGSGGLTKFNRTQRGLPKAHWIDAACVGTSTSADLQFAGIVPLLITATGHGNRQKCNVNELGIACSKPKGGKSVKGYRTGDIVRAVVTTGSKQGIYVGRVLVRASGSFDIRTRSGRVQGISHRFCTPVHRCDGYSYKIGVRYADHPTQATE
jgi:5-methylcytosine-specific restriction endonuclease McrA